MTTLISNELDHHSLADWQDLAAKSLRDTTLAELAHTTASGLPIQPLYTTRPNTPEKANAQPMRRWDNRLMVIGENAQVQNTNVLNGLKGGVDSLQITLDSPEQATGIQSDQLASVLTNVQLEIIPISLSAGSQFVKATAQLESIWTANNIAPDKVAASLNADPIGTLASTGNLATDLNTLLLDMTTLAIKTNAASPQVNAVCVNSTCYHNAGATIEQELVATIATGVIYLQHLIDAGISPQAANDTMVFQVACDADNIANIVKLRVLKQLWVHIAKQFNIANPKLQLVVETSQRMLSNTSPWVNHLRNVSAATAAAMADAQSIIVHPHNYIDNQFIDDQTELAARVARNIPIILSEESTLTFVHDPMAGSYAIESLTSELLRTSWQALQKLETEGGLINALMSGDWQKAIAKSQATRASRLQQEQDIQVGVNKYKNPTVAPAKSTSKPLPAKALPINVAALKTIRDATEFEAKS